MAAGGRAGTRSEKARQQRTVPAKGTPPYGAGLGRSTSTPSSRRTSSKSFPAGAGQCHPTQHGLLRGMISHTAWYRSRLTVPRLPRTAARMRFLRGGGAKSLRLRPPLRIDPLQPHDVPGIARRAPRCSTLCGVATRHATPPTLLQPTLQPRAVPARHGVHGAHARRDGRLGLRLRPPARGRAHLCCPCLADAAALLTVAQAEL